jgi:peptidoglycan/xylan/chitin deacetylase (PgdA/CDA1 family)
MTMRPFASVSLDVDNLWSYLKTHGDPEWETRPTYLPRFVPLALEALAELDLRITFFIVGIDTEREENVEALAAIPQAGHEIGNHSYEHEPWLHRYSRQALAQEIERAEEAILAATGQRPKGFRGPGFSWSPELLSILAARGYDYDASTFPTFLGPLARAYYFWTARLTKSQRQERKALFGTMREGLRPLAPYRWQLEGDQTLLEIPVTTAPLVRTPFHLSYLLYLSRWSEAVAAGYLRSVVALCKATGLSPSFLLHPLDLLGAEDVPALRFFPGMDLSSEHKAHLFRRMLSLLGRHFDVVTMGRHAALANQDGHLRTVVPAPAISPGGP